MILVIDTSDPLMVKLYLVGQRKPAVSHIFHAERSLSEKLLPEIEKFFKKQKIELSKLIKIAVFAGPGHFSRIRTAIATANALAYGLKIKVVALDKPEFDQAVLSKAGQSIAHPVYEKEPNISKPK